MKKSALLRGGVAIAVLLLSTVAAAKDRVYHRMKDSKVIVVPEGRAAPAGMREIAVKDIDRVMPPPTDRGARVKRDKYHEVGNTRIVWLRPGPNPGFTSFETLKLDRTVAVPR